MRQAVTLRQVAEAAGCSTAVASTVLNGARGNTGVAELTRQRVCEIAKRLGYRPHSGARMLRRRRSGQIGVLLKNNPADRYHDPAILDYLLGINDGLQQADYLMSLIRYDDIGSGALDSRAFREWMLEGMIVVGAIPRGCRRKLEALMPHCVWLDTSARDARGCLRRDEIEAGRIVAQAVTDLGYRRILYLANPDHDELDRTQTHYSHADRLKGLRKGTDLAVDVLPVPWAASGQVFPDQRKSLDAHTAVVAYNAILARRFAIAAATWGTRIGRDCGLACCDSSLDIDATWPSLSRVGFDRYALGVEAARMIAAGLEGEKARSADVVGTWVAGDTLPPRC